MSDDFKNVFDEICRERGGRQSLGVVGVSIARSLAQALCDPATPPSIIANLSASLPPKMQPDEKPLDLRILTDAELRQLEFLVRRASGEQVERPPRIRRSRREEEAFALAQYVDAVGRGKAPPTDGQLNEIRNRVFIVLSPVTNPDTVFAYLAGSRPAPTLALPTATHPASSAPKAENVVALTRPGHR
jgi:hypothetical protein